MAGLSTRQTEVSAAVVRELNDLQSGLLSEKATTRKDAVKKLSAALDSQDVLQALDLQTLRLRAKGKVAVASWPGLVTVLISCVQKELASAKTRGPDAGLARTFRKYVQSAEDDRRSGHKSLLLRRAGKLFSHVKETLERTSLASPFGTEYSTMLRNHLLAYTPYCQSATSTVFQELLHLFMTKLEAQALNRSEETFRAASSLQLLVQRFPADMEPDFQQDMLLFFRHMFPQLHSLREDSRLSLSLLTALNSFLLTNGLDVSSKAGTLHDALHPYVVRAWRHAREPKLKEGLLTYLRLQLRLQALQGLPGVTELRDVLEQDLLMPAFSWGEARKGGLLQLGKQQQALLSVLASLHFYGAQQVASTMADLDEDVLPTKRARRSSPLAGLLEQALEAPARYAPVLAVLLRQHGRQLEARLYRDWLRVLCAGLASPRLGLLAAPSLEEGSDSRCWLLRLIAELAKAWPLVNGVMNGEDGEDEPIMADSSGTALPDWKIVGEALEQMVSLAAPCAVVHQETMLALAVLAERRLAKSSQRTNRLWALPALVQHGISEPVLQLLAAVLPSESSGGTQEAGMRHNVLELVLSSGLPDLAPGLASKTVLALLNIPDTAQPLDQPGVRWWPEDAEAAALQAQLRHLTRGREYAAMRVPPDPVQTSGGLEEGGGQASLAAMIRLRETAAARLADLVRDGLDACHGENTARLPQLLCVTSIGFRCAANIQAAVQHLHASIDDAWAPEGVLAGVLLEAVGRVSQLVAASCRSQVGLSALHLDLLQQLAEALASYTAVSQDHRLAMLVSKWAGELEHAFLEAARLSASSLNAVQQAQGNDAAGPQQMFDDDLDVQAPVASSSGRPAAGVATAAAHASQLRQQSVQLLRCLGKVHPACVSAALERIWQACQAEKEPVSEEILDDVAVALCSTAGVGLAGSCSGALSTAVAALDAQTGLLARRRFHNPTLLLVLGEVERLAQQLRLLGPAGLRAHQDGFEGLIAVVEASMGLISTVDSRSDSERRSQWQVRVGLARALVALFDLDMQPFLEDPAFRDDCTARVVHLLQDVSYFARREVGEIIPCLYTKWTNVQGQFDEFVQRLSLRNLQNTGQDLSNEHMETGVLMLGESAAACQEVEGRALYLLCSHAACAPSQHACVEAVLEALARRLNYPSRHAYVAYHLTGFIYMWFSNAHTLDQLLDIQALVALDGGAAYGSPTSFFSQAYLRVLVPVMLLDQRADDLQKLSELRGETVSQLLRRVVDSIFGTVLPYVTTGNSEDKKMATSVLQKGIMDKHLPAAQRDAAFAANIVGVLGQMLLLASSQEAPAKPYFPLATIVKSICNVPGRQDAAANVEIIWNKVLCGDGVARLLLLVHEALQRARHPRHQSQALAALQALLLLLGPRVRAAATATYATHILLQLMRSRELQELCCQLLGDIVDQLVKEPDARATLGALLPALVSAAAEGVEAQEATAGHDAGHPCVKLILRLTTQAPAGLQPFLRQVDTLPAVPALAAARELLECVRQDVSLPEDLQQLAGRAVSLSARQRHRSLAALATRLHTHTHQLFLSARPLPTSSPAAGRTCRPDVVQAAWRLVWLSADLADDQLAAFAGELLAVMGPLEPYTIAFNAAPTSPAALLVSGPAGADNGRASNSSAPEGAAGMLVAALQLLVGYLVDQHPPIIKTAQFTCRQLLATPSALAALAHLDPASRAHLQVYMQQPTEPYVPSGKEAVNPQWQLDNPQLWTLVGRPYEQWVCRLAYALLLRARSPTLHFCMHMAKRKAAFAELLLPYILADLAANDCNGSLGALISQQVSCHLLASSPPAPLQALRLLLSCLNSLRSCRLDAALGLARHSLHRLERPLKAGRGTHASQNGNAPGESPAFWPKAYWLDVDYLAVAAAALRCSACFTALLYAEHWCEEEHGRLALGEERTLNEASLPMADQLLLDIYGQIDEPDGIYALARSHVIASQLRLYQHEGAWSKVLAGYDMLLRQASARAPPAPRASQRAPAQPQQAAQAGLVAALQQLGCSHLLQAYVTSASTAAGPGSSALAEVQAESAWRLGQWDGAAEVPAAPVEPTLASNAICAGLKALEDGDRELCQSVLFGGRAQIVRALAASSTESAKAINPACVRLQLLEGLREAWALRWPARPLTLTPTTPTPPADGDWQAKVPSRHELQAVEDAWQARQAAAGGRYELLEPLLSMRRVVMAALQAEEGQVASLLQLARAARKAGQLAHSMAAIHQLRTLRQAAPAQAGVGGEEWQVEEAKLLWAGGQAAMAVRMAKALLQLIDSEQPPGSSTPPRHHLHAHLLCLTAKWLAASRSESSSSILQMMMRAAGAGPGGAGAPGLACRTSFRLAHYADTLYRGIQDHKRSPEWNTSQAVIRHKKQQVILLQARLEQREVRGEVKRNAGGEVTDRESRQLMSHINQLQRPISFDEEENAVLQANEGRFLLIALANYRRCLAASNAYDNAVVFRLCQLWFALGTNAEVNKALALSFQQIPSYKFLPLVYQIASRMSAAKTGQLVESGFQGTVAALLERLAREHPYHTLYQLYALKNGNRGRDGQVTGQQGNVGGGMAHSADMDKVAAARAILDRLAADPTRGQLVDQVSQLIEAYISLAALVTAPEVTEMAFPTKLRRQLKSLALVPLPSVSLPVDPAATYTDFAHFNGFGDKIQFVGGINRPKLVVCLDNLGGRHRQLVKSGNDDMRQDAVMQQFFGLINNVLQDCTATRKRKLHIVTYKVVPFSPASGLLEWVEETMPLSEYLTGADRVTGAHKRYGKPDDINFVQCFQSMQKAQRSMLPPCFDEVCRRFTPCLHHFFLEFFREPATWFERRLAYTRSVAVNSMAGYIIGLGDRHAHNILIDKSSASVVHIDLGVAFEQGRFLNTPELVPFRLTRDVVDGMGATGVEGVMRRCCEETLRVLRANKESLLTIIEVFIHDPLYKWALTPMGAQQRQKDSLGGEEGGGGEGLEVASSPAGEAGTTLANADAERALLRVKQKLDGLEGGEGEGRGVEGQVQQLLHDAQDPDKLCRMYVGWAAWM